ncbi:hypothetical protein SLA2020_331310 [Shorea laevis]
MDAFLFDFAGHILIGLAKDHFCCSIGLGGTLVLLLNQYGVEDLHNSQACFPCFRLLPNGQDDGVELVPLWALPYPMWPSTQISISLYFGSFFTTIIHFPLTFKGFGWPM